MASEAANTIGAEHPVAHCREERDEKLALDTHNAAMAEDLLGKRLP
jgi:hypothetical protein